VSQIQKPLNVAAKGVTPTSLGAEIRRVINCSTGVNFRKPDQNRHGKVSDIYFIKHALFDIKIGTIS